jgi:hypothetical protein
MLKKQLLFDISYCTCNIHTHIHAKIRIHIAKLKISKKSLDSIIVQT